MLEICLVIQSLNLFEHFCLWALMIVINESVATCQLQIFFSWKKVYCRWSKTML